MKKLMLAMLGSFLVIGCIPRVSSSTPNVSSNGLESSSTSFDAYYVIDTSKITSEMLLGSSVELDVSFKNLGETATPDYAVSIVDDLLVDVTSTTYVSATRLFTPLSIGDYSIKFSVLDEKGDLYLTSDDTSFERTIIISVVKQSFEPVNSAGEDVEIDDSGNESVITFGSSYAVGSSKKTSGQYRITGLTFLDNYYITYQLKDVVYGDNYADPSLYFGWNRNNEELSDDCIKLSSGNGTMAAWVWAGSNQANLGNNSDHGWFINGWWNAPNSVSNLAPVSGDHTLRFERYIDKVNEVAVYGIIYDDVAFTYLDVGSNYTDLQKSVWIETNNTSMSLSVIDFGIVTDEIAPEISLEYADTYVNSSLLLKTGVTVTDNSIYQDVLARQYVVRDSLNAVVETENDTFTPLVVGDYSLSVKVKDLAGNVGEETTVLHVVPKPVQDTIIDLTETASVARVGGGIIIYASATHQEVPVTNLAYKAFLGGVDVSATVLREITSNDTSLKYQVFAPTSAGIYDLQVSVNDVSEHLSIEASTSLTSVYGFTYYDAGFEGVIVGRDEVIYATPTGLETGKLGKGLSRVTNWELSFDLTDLSFSKNNGSIWYTLESKKSDGTGGNWEDIRVGGNQGTDLWGYEASIIGSGWNTYQWRSNWQDKTTEFMPNPEDASIGCGRGSGEYAQYATGTHHYKVICTT
ncbi:MAG: hypothetical protein LBM99_06190, partial [Bacillales bacterium]|nr:hypothetical protein [Bacillales bacterium]